MHSQEAIWLDEVEAKSSISRSRSTKAMTESWDTQIATDSDDQTHEIETSLVLSPPPQYYIDPDSLSSLRAMGHARVLTRDALGPPPRCRYT